MTRAQRVDYLASAAGMLAMAGEVFVLPDGTGAVAWRSEGLTALVWRDGNDDARCDVFAAGTKVLATAWRPGAKRHQAISFKRGAWEQSLATAALAMVATMELESGASVH